MEAKTMMNLILWLVAGAVVGWLAGMVMNDRGGVMLNIVVGIVGAMIGGFLFGGPTINSSAFNAAAPLRGVNLTALVVSFVGAIILLAIVNLVRRGRVR
jgi:uncharacterized membrane protein YeaQ/YmgE (transglycosylase-associated protein family)